MPLLARRGGRDIKEDIAKLPLMERTGWWVKIEKDLLTHHPVCAASDASLFLLSGAATPPGQEGQSLKNQDYFLDRKERSTVSRGSSETGWSRHSHRIISGSIAPPILWLCTPIPQE